MFPITYYLSTHDDTLNDASNISNANALRANLRRRGVAFAEGTFTSPAGSHSIVAIIDDRPYSSEVAKLVQGLAEYYDQPYYLRVDGVRQAMICVTSTKDRIPMGRWQGVEQSQAGDTYIQRGERYFVVKAEIKS
tara:strand:- start:479 stop:883 length:405 start_codon:yes stop_codon:yes gene_type:complete